MKKYIVGFSSEIKKDLILKIKKIINTKNINFKTINIKNEGKKIVKDLNILDFFVTKYFCIPNEFLKEKKKLKLLQLTTSDYSFLNSEILNNKSFIVANNGGANSVSVAEHTFLLMLSIYRNFLDQVIIKKKRWINLKYKNRELKDKKIGIIGMGNVGKELANRCLAFGMKVSYFDNVRLSVKQEKKMKLKFSKLEKIFKESHIVSLNMSSNRYSEKMINVNLLSKMKQNSIIINTSRGKNLKEKIITKVLKNKKIFVALDVFDQEPLPINSPLRSLDNILMTPHCGPSLETVDKLAKNISSNIITLCKGKRDINIIGKL